MTFEQRPGGNERVMQVGEGENPGRAHCLFGGSAEVCTWVLRRSKEASVAGVE